MRAGQNSKNIQYIDNMRTNDDFSFIYLIASIVTDGELLCENRYQMSLFLKVKLLAVDNVESGCDVRLLRKLNVRLERSGKGTLANKSKNEKFERRLRAGNAIGGSTEVSLLRKT